MQIRNKKVIDKYIEIFPNSSEIKDIAVSSDERLLAISYKDGTILTYTLDLEGIKFYLETFSLNVKNSHNEYYQPKTIGEQLHIGLLHLSKNNQDYLDHPINALKTIKKNNYGSAKKDNLKKKRDDLEILISLEKEKKEAEEKEKLKKAEEIKNKNRIKIHKLREDYYKVVQQNKSLHEELRLLPDEMIVDEQYLDIIRKQKEDHLSDIKHKYDWLKANIQVTINKLNSFYINSVKTQKVYVFALKSNEYVTTLRCPNLPNTFYDEILNLSGLIEDFEKKIDFDSLDKVYRTYIVNNEGKNENEDDFIEGVLSKCRGRLENYQENNKESSSKNPDNHKNGIKDELDATNEDLSGLKNILESKKLIKDKTLKSYKENREKHKKKFGRKDTNRVDNKIKCPDSYSLKINYDRYYTEQTMKTTFLHRKKMFDFLKLLYDEREEYNKQVLDLRNKKVELMKKLQVYKGKITEINAELGIDSSMEKLDWLDFQMKEQYEFPERDLMIKEDELEKYAIDKSKNEKGLVFLNDKNDQIIQSENNSNESTNGTMKLLYGDRGSKKTNETHIESELRSINQIRFDYKKAKLVQECKKMIEDFDHEVHELKKRKVMTHFKQKLGELELFIKHEEYSILRAFESDDALLIRKLEDLCNDFRENLNSLKNCHEGIVTSEEELTRAIQDKQLKEKEFYNLIAQEKESREQLIKCFKQRKKAEISKDNLGDDKIDNDDELDLPRNISNQLKQEILSLRDSREHFDQTIEKLTKNITNSKKQKQNLIHAKLNLDRRRDDLRDKINANERKKARYLNLVDIAVPLNLDQFSKLELPFGELKDKNSLAKLPLDISKAILISRTKLFNLEELYRQIISENKNFEEEIVKFNSEYDDMEKSKKELEKEYKDLDTLFKNEQILKFGLIIDFDYLLKATKDTTVDKLEAEYKILKREADRLIDEFKIRIDEMKREWQNQVNDNTELLKKIKDLLEKNKKFDITLEEKNNEINVRLFYFIHFRKKITKNILCTTLKKRKKN